MPEMQNIEWKAKWKDDYLEWICGFANAQGGKIYIGCNDDGEVVGLSNTRKLLEDIPNKIRNAMSIVVDVNLLTQGGKEYIEIVVPPYPVAISCKGIYYYRSGSTMQTLSGPELESFILRKRGASWDNMPLPGFTIDDIDDSLVEKFKKLAAKKGRIDKSVLEESKADLMEKLRLTNAGYYTNAAMLLFSKNPDKWQLGAYTKIGYFETDADLRYQDEIHGSLLEQIDKIIEVLYLKFMKAKISYEGIQRIERYFVADEALRESLLNALCHKQYESCTPIQISVYDDHLYIANCGKLPENWTVDNLMSKHASKPYNPSIANVYYLAGLIESWGRGIEKIYQACDEDGSPRPEYTVNPGDIMIKFTASEDRIIRIGSQEVTAKVTAKVTIKVTDKEKKVLDLIREDPGYSMDEIAKKLSISRKTVAARIKSLKEKGILKRIGATKNGHWQINNEQMPNF
ncbi:MAG: winged helix-turn-helix transcriptional regulator [Lachnospiraceae bacterium]|nr:winged helix-turn-helix transcriptional regulator [Lachnospiraceae bacterium]